MGIVEPKAEKLPIVSGKFDDISTGRRAFHFFYFIAKNPLMAAENPAFFTTLEDDLFLQIFFLLPRVA